MLWSIINNHYRLSRLVIYVKIKVKHQIVHYMNLSISLKLKEHIKYILSQAPKRILALEAVDLRPHYQRAILHISEGITACESEIVLFCQWSLD